MYSECIFISTEESPPAAAEENAPTARSKRSEAVQSRLVLLHQTIYQLSTVGGCKPLPFARRSSGFSEFYEKVKPRSFDYIFRIVQNRCRPCWLSIETWRPFSAQKHHQSNCYQRWPQAPQRKFTPPKINRLPSLPPTLLGQTCRISCFRE